MTECEELSTAQLSRACKFGKKSLLPLNPEMREYSGMARTTATFSISLPPEMLAWVDELRMREHRTRSELIREALRRYFAAIP
jgi:hypothetical protein